MLSLVYETEISPYQCGPDHRHTCQNWIETGEKCRKKYFPSRFTPEHEKSRLLRALVNVVWPCSRIEKQKASEKLSLVYV